MAVDVSPIVPAGRQLIESYGNKGFQVSGVRYEGSVIVFPDRTLPWDVSCMQDVTEDRLAVIQEAAEKIEVLLIGCGQTAAFVPKPVRAALRAQGVVIEAMDSGAACRTYNVLMSEERQVAAALIAIE